MWGLAIAARRIQRWEAGRDGGKLVVNPGVESPPGSAQGRMQAFPGAATRGGENPTDTGNRLMVLLVQCGAGYLPRYAVAYWKSAPCRLRWHSTATGTPYPERDGMMVASGERRS